MILGLATKKSKISRPWHTPLYFDQSALSTYRNKVPGICNQIDCEAQLKAIICHSILHHLKQPGDTLENLLKKQNYF